MNSYKKLIFPLILITAGLLRLCALLKYGDFWGDEMFSFVYSQKPWADSLLKFWIWETNPPLHMFFLKLWLCIFPANEFWARLPSLIFGFLSIIYIYRLADKLFNKTIGLLAAAFLAFNSYHVFISATARTYSLLVLLVIIATYYFYLAFLASNGRALKHKIFYAAAIGLLLYSHLTAVLVLVGQLVALKIFKGNIASWLKTASLPLALWLIWLLPALYTKAASPSFGSAWFFQLNHGWNDIIQAIQPIFIGPGSRLAGAIIIIIFVAITIYTFYKQIKQRVLEKKFLLLAAIVVIPFISAAVLNLWNIKFFLVALPPIIIMMGYLLNLYLRPLAIVFLFIALLLLPGLYNLNKLLPINNWQTINNFVAKNYDSQKKQILVYIQFSDERQVGRYFNGVIASLPYCAKKGDQGWDYDMVTKNYLRYFHPPTEIQKWIAEHKINQYDEIFLLNNDDNGIGVKSILEKEGWRKKQTIKPGIMEYRELIYYAKS